MTGVRAVRLGLAAGVLLGALAAGTTGGGSPPFLTWVVHAGADGTFRLGVQIGGMPWVVVGLAAVLLTSGQRG